MGLTANFISNTYSVKPILCNKTSDNWDQFLEESEKILMKLGPINTEIENDQTSIGDLVQFVEPMLNALVVLTCFGHIPKALVNRVIRIISMPLSSLEKHLRDIGESPGTAFSLIPQGLEDILIDCAKITGRVPRDDHKTYWELSPNITFTGNEGEISFTRTVKKSITILRQTDYVLQSIKRNEEFESTKTRANLQSCLGLLETLQADFKKLNSSLSPGFFSGRMRQYLLHYPVKGQIYSGPNAKYFNDFPKMDLLFGIRNSWYIEKLSERSAFMDSRDFLSLYKSFNDPSIVDVLLKQLNLDSSESTDEVTVALSLSKRSRKFQESFRILTQMAKTWVQISGNHLAQICSNLKRNQDDNLIVRPDEGVSGTPLQETFDIHRLRQNCWLSNTGLKSINMLENAR